MMIDSYNLVTMDGMQYLVDVSQCVGVSKNVDGTFRQAGFDTIVKKYFSPTKVNPDTREPLEW